MDIIKPSQPEQRIETPPTGSLSTDDLTPLSGYFGSSSVEDKDQLNFIYQFFSGAGVKTMPEMLLSIKQIETRLGVAPMGKSRVNQLYEYLKIQQDISRLTQLRDSYHGW